jgi:hypothetical protein
MASVIRVQIRRRSRKRLLVWLNRNSAPRIEARALLVMVGKNGTTIAAGALSDEHLTGRDRDMSTAAIN